jgi:putative transposase
MGEDAWQPLSALTESERARAMDRWMVLRPTVEDGVPLTRSAAHAGVPISTARRWLARYRCEGLVGLARSPRCDRGTRRTAPELVSLIEGLALSRPRPSMATIARRASQAAGERGWAAPAYSTVAAIVAALDPALMALAHDGPDAFRDRFELVYRRRAERPNDVWQADHTELDMLIVDADGTPARPWLTLILDDHSRAVAGYTVFLGAPSALNLSLALRQAIWQKTDPRWPLHGLPDVLHVDHGSDFTSHHIAQVAADLHMQLIYSGVARPQGRGKVERLFGTINSELLPELPGHLVHGKPASAPRLTLAALDAAIAAWIVGTYHRRVHRETKATPHDAWIADGWLPRSPESLEALDMLLVSVATARVVHRDGIRFQGLRYLDPALLSRVREHVGERRPEPQRSVAGDELGARSFRAR